MDRDEADGSNEYLLVEAPTLPNEKIQEIIQGYGINEEEAKYWARECEGSPRVAHVVSSNLRENPDDPLREDGMRGVWTRFIAGDEDPKSDPVKRKALVLQCLALFKRFGWEGPTHDEATAIYHNVITKLEDISLAQFNDIVNGMRARKVLQGQVTLYITPKLLHVRLWLDWWNAYGDTLDIIKLYKSLPDALKTWFARMFAYAKDSRAASDVAEQLLSVGGPFADSEFLNSEEGSGFFFQLAQARPRSALNLLNSTIGKWPVSDLEEFSEGRRNVIWALESIAADKRYFSDSARLLLALAEAENEHWANSATGIFKNLFSLGYGRVSATEAPPDQRLPILHEALASDSAKRRELAFDAFDQALNIRYISRSGDTYAPGLKRERREWTPATYGELFEAYRLYWSEAEQATNNAKTNDERTKGFNVLLNHARELISVEPLGNMVIDFLENYSQNASESEKKQILKRVIEILYYDKKDIEDSYKQRLIDLRENLTGSDFSSHLRRFVGMDLLEDKYDKRRRQVDKADTRINDLASAAAKDHDLLAPQLGWLFTKEAENGFKFGNALAEADIEFALWPPVLDGWINALRDQPEEISDTFIGGYLAGVFEQSEDAWEHFMEQIADNAEARPLIVELTWRSGITETAIKRILNLIESGKVELIKLRLFSYGGVIRNIPKSYLNKMIKLLLKQNEYKYASVALDLLGFYYHGKEKRRRLDKKLTQDLLFHPALFEDVREKDIGQMDDYHWIQLAKMYLEDYPEEKINIAKFIFRGFGAKGTIFKRHNNELEEVLEELIKDDPKKIWELIISKITPPADDNGFWILEWLRGGLGFRADRAQAPLTLIPSTEIFKWIDQDVAKHSLQIARFMPIKLDYENDDPPLAIQFLKRYGDNESVRNSLRGSYFSESWSGPSSLHYAAKMRELDELEAKETNGNVLLWISETKESVASTIEHEQIREEREDF